MTLLVIDGMDRAGKDTIVRGLVARRQTTKPLHTIHNMAPPRTFDGATARKYHLKLYQEQFDMVHARADWIINRSLLSEQVYGHMYRGQEQFFKNTFYEDLHDSLEDVSHLFLTLTADPVGVLARDDGDSTFNKGNGDRLANAVRERDLFIEGHERLVQAHIRCAHYHDIPPEKLLEDVAALLGW